MHCENFSARAKNVAGEPRSPPVAAGPVLVFADVEPRFATVDPGADPPQPAASAAATAAAIVLVKARGRISCLLRELVICDRLDALGGYTAVTGTVTSL
jgi:hypothetical protein